MRATCRILRAAFGDVETVPAGADAPGPAGAGAADADPDADGTVVVALVGAHFECHVS